MRPSRHLLHALTLTAACLGSGGAHAQASLCASGTPVKFAGIPWESGQFYTDLIRVIAEAGLGCKTEVVTGSTAATETALYNNDLQVHAEQWNRTDVIKKGQEAGKIKLIGDLLSGGGAVEGFFVPEFVVKGDAKRGIKASAPDLKSIADLPRYKALFADEEEPGKGRLLSCPVGWDCEKINTQKLKAYKLEGDYTNFRAGTGAALDAAISSAMERGKPVLFYYWSPATLMGKYKFFQVAEPAYNEKCWATEKDAKVQDVCPSATPNSKLTVGVSTPLLKSDPELVDLISKVQLTPEQINSSILKMSERKVSGEVVAKEFLKANPEVWKSWVPAPVAGKVLASLK